MNDRLYDMMIFYLIRKFMPWIFKRAVSARRFYNIVRHSSWELFISNLLVNPNQINLKFISTQADISSLHNLSHHVTTILNIIS